MSIAFKHGHHHGSSGKVDPKQMDSAVESIMAEVTLDRSCDVPYCAGYSKEWDDAKTVYIDRDVPKFFTLNGKKCDVTRYLVLHECIEKTLMEVLGLEYEPAHNIATTVEEQAVKDDGHDLKQYNAEWDKIIRKVGSRGKYPNVPKDLDTEPYSDEHDTKDEKEMDGGSLFYNKKGSY